MIGTDAGPWSLRLGTAALASLVFACGGDTPGTERSPTEPGPPPAAIAEISISPPGAALFTGTSVVVEAKAVDVSGRPVSTSFSWSTSDVAVATVDSDGSGSARVDGTGVGEATISATAGGKTASALVLVDPTLSNGNDRASTGFGRLLQEEEPHLVIRDEGLLFGAWQDFGLPCCVLFSRSSDGGKNWTNEVPLPPHRSVDLPQTLSQKDPWLALDEQGNLYFAWLEEIVHVTANQQVVLDTSLVLVARSGDGGNTWSTPVNVQSVQPGKADKTSIASDAEGVLYVGYSLFGSDFQPFGSDESVVVSRSVDGGETWSTPVELATGNVLISNIAAGPAGQVCAGWKNFSTRSVEVGCSSDRGIAWRVTSLGEVAVRDERLFNSGPGVAASRRGIFVVSWIDPESNLMVVRSVDAGATWSEPTAVNDEPRASRWQPTVTVGPDDRLHATWYDARTGAIHVVYSSSSDGGSTWSRNLRVSSEPTPFGRTGPNGTRLGDYMGLAAAEDGSVHVLWTDWRSASQDIFHGRIP